MPQLLALLPAILTSAAAATGIGTGIYSATQGGGGATPAIASGPTPEDATKTKRGQIAALSQQFPGIQAATGGSLSPEAWIRLAELLSSQAGTPGIGAAEQDILKLLKGGGSNVSVGISTGGSSTGTAGLTPGGVYA